MIINQRHRPMLLVYLGLAVFSLLLVSPCRAQGIDNPKFVAFAGAGAVTTSARSLG
jgi:hypothetical protein